MADSRIRSGTALSVLVGIAEGEQDHADQKAEQRQRPDGRTGADRFPVAIAAALPPEQRRAARQQYRRRRQQQREVRRSEHGGADQPCRSQSQASQYQRQTTTS